MNSNKVKGTVYEMWTLPLYFVYFYRLKLAPKTQTYAWNHQKLLIVTSWDFFFKDKKGKN